MCGNCLLCMWYWTPNRLYRPDYDGTGKCLPVLLHFTGIDRRMQGQPRYKGLPVIMSICYLFYCCLFLVTNLVHIRNIVAVVCWVVFKKWLLRFIFTMDNGQVL